jgi:hypothetical protein
MRVCDEGATFCQARRRQIGLRSRTCGSAEARRVRRACRCGCSSNQEALRPDSRRAKGRCQAGAPVAHAGHMRLENLRGDSWNRGRRRSWKTRMKSQGRADSWRAGEIREHHPASLPRRRSPVRTRCSAPISPDSTHLVDPGSFMAVAFHGDATGSQRLRGVVALRGEPAHWRMVPMPFPGILEQGWNICLPVWSVRSSRVVRDARKDAPTARKECVRPSHKRTLLAYLRK